MANAISVNKKELDHDLRIDTTTTKGGKEVSVEPLPVKVKVAKSFAFDPPTDTDHLDDRDDQEEEYVPRWARSSKQKSDGDNEINDDPSGSMREDERYTPTDDLPIFADDAARALHDEIKLLEQRRDEAASSTRSNKERISIINDHLHSIRQEINHTNSLVAAKKSEVDTEEHLLSLSQREFGQCLRDISGIERRNLATQNNIQNIRWQIKVAEDELDKLRTDFNLNQEELEQWATAATKKEEESLALQKYALADGLKIEELTLTIEDLTKRLVEKKTLLENEVTETRSNQTELEKMAERFKSRHDERRQFLHQWKETIESMNNRDEAINDLARQYARLTKREDDLKKARQGQREQFMILEVRLPRAFSTWCHHPVLLRLTFIIPSIKNENKSSQQDIENKERLLQTKRQEYSSLRESENVLREEVGTVQIETSMAASMVDSKRAEYRRINAGLQEKQNRVGVLTKQLEEIDNSLANEKLGTSSTEQLMETIVKSLANHEKELKQSEKNISLLKKTLYNDSKRLVELQRKESDLISELRGIKANIKNYASKVNELDNRHAAQQELLSNANFQLQQMEKKVSRGLGERSDEEQMQLQWQIKSLEATLEAETKKKLMLTQQKRKLQVELRAWNKKYDASESKYSETRKMIDGAEAQIFAYGQKIKEIVATKEEAMILHDVTVLDVRRLRDSLRNLLVAVYSLKDQAAKSSSSMEEKKKEIIKLIKSKISQLRISKEERHKLIVELGKAKIGLEKTKAKFNVISAVNARKGKGEEYESPELKLILAAQRREELQREGDKLDASIQQKENEIRTLKQTVAQLREVNSNLRCSFSRADVNGAEARELKELEQTTQSTEESLFRVRKELQALQKRMAEDKLEIERISGRTK
jgi:chromosome segregation ATPase